MKPKDHRMHNRATLLAHLANCKMSMHKALARTKQALDAWEKDWTSTPAERVAAKDALDRLLAELEQASMTLYGDALGAIDDVAW